MDNKIPATLAHVVDVVNIVCRDLDPSGHFRPFSAGRWVRLIHLAADEDIEHVLLMLDAEPTLLTAYVIVHLDDAAHHAVALAQAIARANYGLLPGCFEIDLDSGETRFRTTLNFRADTIKHREVAQLLADALLMTKTYAPAFRKVIQSGVSPMDAIEEIESA